jgi:Na+/melibiose symporter-like transporter
MKFKKIKWVEDQRQYSSGLVAMVGRIAIGSVFWNGFTSKNDPKKYTVNCKLTGIKEYLGSYLTQEEGNNRLEITYLGWQKELIDK